MNVLDRRNFGAEQKICYLGQWNNETVFLDQIVCPNPALSIRTEGENGVARLRVSISLQGKTLHDYRFDAGVLCLLLSEQQTVQCIVVDLTQEPNQKIVKEFSFCGTVTDARLVSCHAWFVQTKENQAHQALYQELKAFSGRSAFLFYCESEEEHCVLVRDLRFAELAPRTITVHNAANAFCAIHNAQTTNDTTEYDPPLLPNGVFWARWDVLRQSLLRGDLELPVQCVQSAAKNQTLRLLSKTEDQFFFCVEETETARVYSLAHSQGSVQTVLEAANGEQVLFVQGLGCCAMQRPSGQIVLRTPQGSQWVLPSAIGVPIAWFEERYFIGTKSNHTVCYDRAERCCTVYDGSVQLLPNGFLIY